MREFRLVREIDPHGVSGTGVVAEGVEFSDGSVVMQWTTDVRSTSFYRNMGDVERIHCHEGTRIFTTGAPFERGWGDCVQDSCENVPFASVGGFDKRSSMEKPDYIIDFEWNHYRAGYVEAAKRLFGDDWQTCGFGWHPVMTIGKA